MRKEEEIIELRMHNLSVDNRTRGTISSPISVATIDGEESCVMTFRDDNEGDVWPISLFKRFAGRSDGFDFGFDDMRELTFGDTVAEEQHALGFCFRLLVECLASDMNEEGVP